MRDSGARRVEAREPAPFDEAHGVEVVLVALVAAVQQRVAHLRRDVLEERAAEGHVDELAAPADPEHGLALAHEFAEEPDLVAVAHAVAGPLRVERRLAVGLGRDVGAALQHQAVERVDVVLLVDPAGRCGAARLRAGHHEGEHLARHHPVGDGLLEVLDALGGQERTARVRVEQAGRYADFQGFHSRAPAPWGRGPGVGAGRRNYIASDLKGAPRARPVDAMTWVARHAAIWA